DGTLLADLHQPGLQAYSEPLAQMGTLLPEATVAIEDGNFWTEPGIDPPRIVSAAWIDWRTKQAAQGASTITQQLVKLRLTGSQLSLDRKVKEAVLAIQLEHTFSKQQILEMYLNTIQYGHTAEGVLAASRIYFHTESKNLDLAQAAMLAGIPQNPNLHNPFGNWPDVKSRQREVLDAMIRKHLVTEVQADLAYAEDLSPPAHMFLPQGQVIGAPQFVDWIERQLYQNYGEKTALQGGLRVVTTVNRTLQALGEKAVVDNVNQDRSRGVTQGAMVAIDPRTGAVTALVGAADPNRNGGQYNWALEIRNPGSSFKMWTYTAAIESGKYTMVTPVVDSALTVNQPGSEPYKPPNYDHRYHGVCIVQACMGNSLNIPAVKVEISTGIERVVDVARRVGAPPYWQDPTTDRYTTDAPAADFGPSLTLGGYGETVLQQATGAATIAAMGVYHKPYGIASIATADGKTIFQADPAKTAKQVVDPRVAFILASMMSNDNNRAMIFGRGSPLTLPGRRVGAKTGTTDNYTDAWTVGYTPSLASAFWFGDSLFRPMQQGFDAVFAAAPAWHNFMGDALGAMSAPAGEWFAPPAGLVDGGFSNGEPVYLLPGTSASQPAPPLPSWASSSAPTPKKTPATRAKPTPAPGG
ncbi:MAG: penicillin-binding protein, partial [Candidatus Dormibacteraeota bacterium]|nr:penicillin-binding protein [Candidatus Dormibacteraeota bacterium]